MRAFTGMLLMTMVVTAAPAEALKPPIPKKTLFKMANLVIVGKVMGVKTDGKPCSRYGISLSSGAR